MDSIMRYELKPITNKIDEYELVLYVQDFSTEFALEFNNDSSEKQNLLKSAKEIVKKRYPNMKVSVVKVIIGGLAVTTLPLAMDMPIAHAAVDSSSTTQVQHVNSTYYQVKPGDTLWSISRNFQTSVALIKQANNLSTDQLKVNQNILIPKDIHIVVKGDSLTSLATKYGVSISNIKEANHLSSDIIQIGQRLVLPFQVEAKQPITQTTKPPVVADKVNTYQVVAGDSLTVIAKHFNTTVDAIKKENKITSDFLRIGQKLNIPTNDIIQDPASNSTTYTVSSGDTLWSIAKQFNTSPDAIRASNGLSNHILSIGQKLTINGQKETIPNTNTNAISTHTVKSGETLWGISRASGVSVDKLKQVNELQTDTLTVGQLLTIPSPNSWESRTEQQPSKVTEDRKTFSYSVKSGDSLSALANRFGVSVDHIRATNNLSSDLLRVGQVLTIPEGLNAPTHSGINTISYTTHTIVSGDTIWDLSVQYGIPQAELLKANNLTTSSRLSIGQKLTIPVHHIGSKQVISEKHGEYMDWWTEAQYVFTIGKTAKVTDLDTGKSFYIKRTVGANHADSETVSINDTNIAKSIWGGFSWTPRAVILEIDGRKIAASMSFMPHEREYIKNNGIDGHFDVYFGESTRHKDGMADATHQKQVERAAGMTKS